jgi:hypothetical protein
MTHVKLCSSMKTHIARVGSLQRRLSVTAYTIFPPSFFFEKKKNIRPAAPPQCHCIFKDICATHALKEAGGGLADSSVR